jgi:enoyl-CoA hydratase
VLRNVKIYKPIIGAINGFCVAGGMEMLGGIDIRIASPNASFAVMEPKRGLFAGGGTTVRLPRQIPFPAAMEFLLTADRIDAPRALDMGLVNQVVPPDELLDAAYTMARRITVNAPLAVQASKRIAHGVDDGVITDEEARWQRLLREVMVVVRSEDAKEGPIAFAEKRAPVWKAR